MTLYVLRDIDELSRKAAAMVSGGASKKEAPSPFTLVLSGGSTPVTLYRMLAAPPYRDDMPWHRVHLFFGDERCVGPEDSASNYRMVKETLLSHISIPPENVHRIMGELEPAEAALEYERELRRFFGEVDLPVFDMVLLGLGRDCHTLSMFPGSAALDEEDRLVKENYIEALGSWRVTMTFPLVNNASNIVFLVAGRDKAGALKEVIEGHYAPDAVPAQRVRPGMGEVVWLVDDGAAALLGNKRG